MPDKVIMMSVTAKSGSIILSESRLFFLNDINIFVDVHGPHANRGYMDA